jgi:hypothetical protein
MYEEMVNLTYITDVRRLHNIILIIRVKGLRLAVHVARMGEKRNVFSYLVGNSKLRRENNIKVDLIGILFESVNWIELVLDRDM